MKASLVITYQSDTESHVIKLGLNIQSFLFPVSPRFNIYPRPRHPNMGFRGRVQRLWHRLLRKPYTRRVPGTVYSNSALKTRSRICF